MEPNFQNYSPQNSIQNIPIFQDFNQDGLPDLLLVNRSGEMLFRTGLSANGTLFDPSKKLNRDDQGRLIHPLVRDVTGVNAGVGKWLIAAADRAGDTVSIYSWNPATRSFARTASLATGMFPVRIGSADLDGNGLGDLVVASAFDGLATIAFQTAPGQFGNIVSRTVGSGPSSINFMDIDGQAGLDIVISGQVSGDVSILFNDTSHTFSSQSRYRGGLGLFGLENGLNGPTVRSLQETASVAVADFTGDGIVDLVALNRGWRSFTLLPGQGQGSFPNPQADNTYLTGERPTQISAGDFNGDGLPDVAILDQASAELWVYLNQSGGRFGQPLRSAAGNEPSSFTVVNFNSDRKLDILVGNEFGDVLILLGDGAGHFNPPPRNLHNLPLAAADLNGDGWSDVVVADQANDRVSVFYRQPGTNQFTDQNRVVLQDPGQAVLAPGAVQYLDLNGDGIPDYLVVANNLANNVLVYQRSATGQFVNPAAYNVGFNPAAITAGYFNQDTVPDLAVANQGSNDVSILLGQINGGRWTATYGPRLNSAGAGPLGVTVVDKNGDRVPDLVVTNSDGKVAAIPGIGSNGQGSGFFRDNNAFTVNVPPPDRTPGTTTIISNNDLYLFDVNSLTARLLYNGRPVSAVDEFGQGYVIGFQDGGLGILEAGSDGLYRLTAHYEGFEDEVSALEVLLNGNGFEVYVTQVGSDIPLIIAGADFIPLVSGPPAHDLAIQWTVPAEAELALLVTLVWIPSSESDTISLQAGNDTSDLLGLFLPPLHEEEEGTAVADEAQEEPLPAAEEAAEAPSWEAYQLGLDQALLQWLEEMKKPADDNPPAADPADETDAVFLELAPSKENRADLGQDTAEAASTSLPPEVLAAAFAALAAPSAPGWGPLTSPQDEEDMDLASLLAPGLLAAGLPGLLAMDRCFGPGPDRATDKPAAAARRPG